MFVKDFINIWERLRVIKYDSCIKTMYGDLDNFEKALAHFGTRVEIIVALELGDKIDSDSAYKMIKAELKDLKKIRKLTKQETND